MLAQAVSILLEMVVLPFTAILLLRFHLQWLHAPLRNPIGEFVMALTNFLVLPCRKRIPAMGHLDTATLLLALIFELLYLAGKLWAQGLGLNSSMLPGLLLLSLVKLLTLSIYLLMIAVFIQAILSWVNPHTRAAPLLAAITQPFLQPIRRLVPALGPVDLSAIILFILCNLLLIPIMELERICMRLMGTFIL